MGTNGRERRTERRAAGEREENAYFCKPRLAFWAKYGIIKKDCRTKIVDVGRDIARKRDEKRG